MSDKPQTDLTKAPDPAKLLQEFLDSNGINLALAAVSLNTGERVSLATAIPKHVLEMWQFQIVPVKRENGNAPA